MINTKMINHIIIGNVSDLTDATVNLSHDSDESPAANANTVASELSGYDGVERHQDYPVLESRHTDIPIPIPGYPDLLPSTVPYFWEVNEHTREFLAKNGITQMTMTTFQSQSEHTQTARDN